MEDYVAQQQSTEPETKNSKHECLAMDSSLFIFFVFVSTDILTFTILVRTILEGDQIELQARLRYAPGV